MVTLLQKAQEVQAQIKATLLNEWDPVGVNGIAGAETEYDAYVKTVHQMLSQGQGKAEIARYLLWVEQDHMGLSPDQQVIAAVSGKIARLKR